MKSSINFFYYFTRRIFVESIKLSKVKIFALGGLGENGKNMYVIEVNNKIFVLDAGLRYPGEDLLGVDAVIPDIKYLIENKERIVGLFLSHAHEDHIGAVPNLLKALNIPVYGTRLTMALVEDSLKEQGENLENFTLNKIRSDNTLTFNDVKVSFYNTTHSIPDSVGICVHTPDGVIVYTSNFTFDQSVDKRYFTSYDLISDVSRVGVLALLSESLSADKLGHTSSVNHLKYELAEAFSQAPGRIIVSVFSSELQRIQQIIDVANEFNRKIAIIGRKMQRIVDIAVKMGYLKFPTSGMLVNLKYIDETNDNNLPNLVVLATGERQEPFDALIRMVRKLDRLIHVEPNDTILIATPPIQGTEIKSARTIDLLYRTGANVIKINKMYLPLSHASAEDLKLMINLLKPKYIIPVIGEYRHQYAQAKIAEQMGYNSENIVLLDNGMVVEFEQGDLVNISNDIEVDQILIDGLSVGEISNVVLKDRVLLSQDGILLAIVSIDMRTRKIIAGPEIVSRGFIYVKENEEIINNVQNILNQSLSEAEAIPKTEWNKVKNDIRDKIGKYLYKETKRKPIIMLVINEL
ncbi:MAG: fold metallo-hydrolase [Haloplasmataceae bacterium]|nr:fold metallo-hydrolase [Haloplasmataceae bacterium]